jgi:hypothetical protein
MPRIQFIADLSRQPFVRLLLFLWAASGAWDLALSEWVPAEYSKRLPRVYEVIGGASGLLSWQVWIVTGALISAFACLEYAFRQRERKDLQTKTKQPMPIPSLNLYAAGPALSADGVVIDPEYVVNICKGKTDLQKKALLAPYAGKFLSVTGIIERIQDINYSTTDGHLELWVDLKCERSLNIQARFPSDNKTVLTQLASGMIITVRGEISQIYFDRLVIINCDVLQIAKA